MKDLKTETINLSAGCARKAELLDYLYGEADGRGRAGFEKHLEACDSCRSELGGFGRVRDDLSLWQVGFAPRTEFVIPRSKWELLRELLGAFPVWVRGAALTAAAAALVLVALSLTRTRVSLRDGDFALSFGATSESAGTAAPAAQDVEKAVEQAVARERKKLQEETRLLMAGLKEQLAAEQKAELRAISAEHQARIQAVRAKLDRQLADLNRQNRSVRPFFDGDNYSDIWSSGR
jgi:hypothetical protein